MEKRTGIVVPLAALYTKDCQAAGDFPALKDFAGFCKDCGLKVIQLLPVNDTGTQSSPYSGLSAFALHPLYIRINALPEFPEAYKNDKEFSAAYDEFTEKFKYSRRFDYTALTTEKNKLLHLLYNYIEKNIASEGKKKKTKVASADGNGSRAEEFNAELEKFVQDNSWVMIYAVYKNLKDSAMQASWKEWPENLQNLNREQIRLRWSNRALKSSHNFFVWCQLRASQQFKDAADYVKSLGIVLKGDIPILMNEDSADAWAWPEYFSHQLRAGSPPDGENPFGQNWGFPTYNWENLSLDSYDWWKTRIAISARYYSAFRIDHVLGFFRIWAVNEGDSTAYLGHTVPYKDISRKTLEAAGFDEGRLHWLSAPHIPTSLIQDITWNYDEATAFLSKVCDRIGNEELWNFKKEIKSDAMIYSQHFTDDERKDQAVKNALAAKRRDCALMEIEKDRFIPVYKYYESTAWNTLNQNEKNSLQDIFHKLNEEELQLWKKQALNVLTPVCGASDMVPCAEDLGVNLSVLPEVLQKLGILSLRVIRWSRNWNENGQPYVPFNSYPELSVATTSVHDSPTLRQWWLNEKDSVDAYLRNSGKEGINRDSPFTEETALFCLESSAKCNSAWFINPLQDYLYLDRNYYLPDPQEERINVPGSVNEFNWTYRMPVSVEDLKENKPLMSKINNIASIHDRM